MGARYLATIFLFVLSSCVRPGGDGNRSTHERSETHTRPDQQSERLGCEKVTQDLARSWERARAGCKSDDDCTEYRCAPIRKDFNHQEIRRLLERQTVECGIDLEELDCVESLPRCAKGRCQLERPS